MYKFQLNNKVNGAIKTMGAYLIKELKTILLGSSIDLVISLQNSLDYIGRSSKESV